MQKIAMWLRQAGAKFNAGIRRFMEGRYGTDKLNILLLRAAVILMIVDIFLPVGVFKGVVWLLSLGLMIVSILRSLSYNTYKRYAENRKYLQLLDAVKDRDHRYFNCPRCHQRVRVPRGKGKISIACPRCHEKFIKKT